MESALHWRQHVPGALRRAAREQLWRKADANGNGFLSLAEIDKALHDEQGFEQLFGAKPVLMRAFQSARQAVKSRDSRGDDYVEKAEFRQLLVALREQGALSFGPRRARAEFSSPR